jgi:hypothetical protein
MRRQVCYPIAIALCAALVPLPAGAADVAAEGAAGANPSVEALQQSFEAFSFGVNNAQYTCPRFLLRWSMDLYRAGAGEDAARIAAVTKANAGLGIRHLSENPAALVSGVVRETDAQMKEKMRAYLKVIVEAADRYTQFFLSGDDKDIDASWTRMAEYDTDIKFLLGRPIPTGKEAMSLARVMCPRWLITCAQSYHYSLRERILEEKGYARNIVPCEQCREVIGSAQVINGVFLKEAGQIQDQVLKEKTAAYIEQMRGLLDSYARLYGSGEASSLETAAKHQERALAIEQEIDDYLRSQTKQ